MRGFAKAAFLLPALLATACCAVDVMPVDELAAGMKGVARTVFSGYAVEELPIEILGVMKAYSAQRDMVLVRCGGSSVERTGVFAGMSGSPVYVDGRLVGALAYTFEFIREPIAGVTPISEMQPVLERRGGASRAPLSREQTARILSSPFSPKWLTLTREPLRVAQLKELPLSICVSHGGAWLGELATSLGGVAAIGGGAAPSEGFELVPGASVSVPIVSGDMDASAAGTLTAIDGERLLAFGHPIFGAGAVSLPLAPAYVHTIVPSQSCSFKLASSAVPFGTVLRDDDPGLGCISGVLPETTHVEVLVRGEDGERQYKFELVKDPVIGPLALGWTLAGCLQQNLRTAGMATIRYVGSLELAGGTSVPLSGAIAEKSSPIGVLGRILTSYLLLVRNPFEDVSIDGIKLAFDVREETTAASIRSAWLEPARARRGERVTVTAELAPYGNGDESVSMEFTVPEDAPIGKLAVTVTDGGSAPFIRQAHSPGRFSPTTLPQLVEVLSEIDPGTSLYLFVETGRMGVNRDGLDYPNLPGSLVGLMGAEGRSGVSPVRSMVEASVDTDWVLAGTHTVFLEVIDGEN